MNRTPFQRPPRWYSPRLSPLVTRLWRPVRRWIQVHRQRLDEVEVRGAGNLKRVVDERAGVLITPNHSSHADSLALYSVSDEVGVPFYVMAAWQNLHFARPARRLLMRLHGVFSVDREGTDLAALRQARAILEKGDHPLVIFPEGEVYHINERVTPFRSGAAGIALMAAHKAAHPVYCVPCAMSYRYTGDPTPELLSLMDELEGALFWRTRPEMDLPGRIYQLAEGLLALKEIEVCGETYHGGLPERLDNLIESILQSVETRHGLQRGGATVPERVKAIRHRTIKSLEKLADDDPAREACYRDLDEMFVVIQLFSYPGDYVSENPTVERIAETLDKFEEDLLRETPTVRGRRSATIAFGEPIRVPGEKAGAPTADELTSQLEDRVQHLLDDCRS